jgi:hypothetical protein
LYIQIHLRIHQESELFHYHWTSQLFPSTVILSIHFDQELPGPTQNSINTLLWFTRLFSDNYQLDEAKLGENKPVPDGFGSDAETEGVWKWVTGPEGFQCGTGTTFMELKTVFGHMEWKKTEPVSKMKIMFITAKAVGIRVLE